MTNDEVQPEWVPVSRLHVPTFRKETEQLQRVRKLFDKVGVSFIPPLIVRPRFGKYQVVDGWHRCKVALERNILELRCFVIE